MNSTWTGVGSKPSFTQTTPGHVPVYGDVQRSRSLKSYDNSKNDRGHNVTDTTSIFSNNPKWIVPLPNFGRDYWGCLCYCFPSLSLQCYQPSNSGITRTLHYKYLWEESNVRVLRETLPLCHRNCFTREPYEPYYMDPVYDVTDNFRIRC